MGANLKIREKSFHRKQAHPLAKVLKKLNVEAEGAVETLVALMSNEDPKIKLAAASKILDFQRDAAADLDRDELQRLIANIKYCGPQGETEEDDTPQIDFSQVHEE